MGALNTLAAIKQLKSAQVLADKLAEEPSGEFANNYENYEFAKTIIREGVIAAEAERKAEALADSLGGDEKANEAEEEDDSPLPPYPPKPDPNNPYVKKFKERSRNPYYNIAKSMLTHGGLIIIALIGRRVYDHFYAGELSMS